MPQALQPASTKAPGKERLTSKVINTNDVVSKYFHCIFYGETDARKTTTAARFGSPEEVRIIMVRRIEQLIPLRSMGYECFLAENASDLSEVIQRPELVFTDPAWINNPNRTLVIDDITEAKDMYMEANEVTTDSFGNVKEVRDTRKVAKGAKDDLKGIVKAALAQPQHLILTAMARTIEDQAQNKMTVTVDLPPSIEALLTTEFEYVFYSIKAAATLPQWQCLTSSEIRSIKKVNEKGREEDYTRITVAKHKLPLERILARQGLLPQRANADLRAIWNLVSGAATNPQGAASK